MNWIMESPVQVAVTGLIFTAILAGGWVQTGYRQLLYAAILVALLAVGLLIIERMIVTDREAVDAKLYQMANDVQTNDVEAIVRHIDADHVDLIQRARQQLPLYTFSTVHIKRVHDIRVDTDHNPPQAVAEFNVVVSGELREFATVQTVPRFVVLTLQKIEGHWKVSDFAEYEATRGFIDKKPQE